MFHLRVQHIETHCLFELTWGEGQRLVQPLPFPQNLMVLYQNWQRAYLSFYQSVQIPLRSPPDDTPLRGKSVASGAISAGSVDWHAKLVEAETKLLYEFHRWLRQEELYEIRDRLMSEGQQTAQSSVDLFLTCTPLDLARLPWEAWDVGGRVTLQISRVPANIRHVSTPVQAQKRRSRPRVLVIIGNDDHLDFQKDWKAVQKTLKSLADIPEPVGWQAGKSIDQLKTEISQAIADPQGWDLLLFAGHSNETQLTGGELGIAPNTSIQVSEIAPQLAIAKERGLQFALFNSCSGLKLAESLIDLGLTQVVVMREPIHNRVAQDFLIRFMQQLAASRNVREALSFACNSLRTEKNLTYPSSHLIPSLFRYPDTQLFQIQPRKWSYWCRQFLPQNYKEVVALTLVLGMSWQLPIQQWLLERRVWTQAIYRQTTLRHQSTVSTPTLLVQIDEQSLLEQEERILPISRRYLAKLVDRLASADAKVIGIDYLLTPPLADDPILANSVAQAGQQGTVFVFGASRDPNTGEWRVSSEAIANPKWSIPGDMAVRGVHYMELPSHSQTQSRPLPLSYLLAHLHQSCASKTAVVQQPCSLSTRQGRQNTLSSDADFSASLLTRFSYGFRQMWLHPIVDYSLSPNQVYTAIPARQLLAEHPTSLQQRTVLIVPNYTIAGVDQENTDNFTAPLAIQHWFDQPHAILTGGQYHAYLLHHYLTQRRVIPIPDLWVVLLAAIAGETTILFWYNVAPRRQRIVILSTGTVIYLLISLELYLSPVAISLPILLPILTFWMYLFPALIQNKM